MTEALVLKYQMNPQIKLEPVKSSNIAAVGYDPNTTVLHVQFINGTTYQYVGVQQKTFQEMQNAKSVGSFFSTNIKANFTGKKL